jgi:hypothetical protein
MYQPTPPPAGGPTAPSQNKSPPPYPNQVQRRDGSRIGAVVAAVAVLAALFGAALGGLGGVLVGAHLSHPTPPSGPPPAPTPTADQVRNQTVDLCTRFATGMRAMPIPQNTSSDVVPMVNYLTTAVADNPAADSEIRAGVIEELRLQRDHASALSREATAGAIQPTQGWTAAPANDVSQRVFDHCRAYQG